MAFNQFPGNPSIQSLLGLGIRLPTAGILQATPLVEHRVVDIRAMDAFHLEHARRQELEAVRALDQRARMMIESRQSQSETVFHLGEPLPPGIDSFDGGNHRSSSSSSRRERSDRDRERGRHRDDRDRGRDREKRRDDDRERWGDQDSGRDRSRHRDRNHNRDRSPLKQSGFDDPEFDAQDKSYDDDRDRSRNRDGDNREGDKWVSGQPSRTIILRGLSQEVDSKMIGAELMVLGIPVKDIRLIRKPSGVSRGFAFVEFHNADDAKLWMDHTQGNLIIQNQYEAHMDYSVSRERPGVRDLQKNDWVCFKCMAHNFKRRDYCYNCNLPRKESEKNKTPDGEEELGTNPCNTLIFRGLDALTTEEGLVAALNQALPSIMGPVKNIAIIRDELNTSRGFGFVEFDSAARSIRVYKALNLMEPYLEVDGKQLLVNYAKNTFNTTMATMQQQSSQYYDYYQQQQQGGQYYDQNTQQYYDYSQYYNQTTASATPTASTSRDTTAGKTNSTNAAAAVAHAAIQQAQAVKNYQKQTTVSSQPQASEKVTVNGVEYPVYPPPDTSSYQYDETSGYYYDPLTQLYYDANSQYYYNSTTGYYMYWDAEKSTYLPAPTNTEETTATDDKGKKEGKEKKDKEKVKIAKKIAKDMEKWAKSMNAQKESLKDGGPPRKLTASGSQGFGLYESASADAGFAIMTKSKEDKSLMPPPTAFGVPEKDGQGPPSGKPGLVASYGGDSDSGDEEDTSAPVDESKLVDWTKLACLLCKRQFQSKEILNKHTQFSDLHKQNLEQLNLSSGASGPDKTEYRDRAKERRKKYGAPEPPEPKKRKGQDQDSAPIPYEQPTKFGVGGENIGNKLLQKMGWSHGQGLGKANQGRTDPIQAERRNENAGLGARGGKVVAEAGDSYRDALKKTMFARYNEMD